MTIQDHPQKAGRTRWWRSVLFWTVLGSSATVIAAILAIVPFIHSDGPSTDPTISNPTLSESRSPSPAASPSIGAGASAPPPESPGGITVVRILPGHGGQIGPSEWRAGSTPGFGIEVFTEAGQVSYSDGCFVAWELKVNGRTTVTSRSRCASGGITPFNTGPLEAGANEVAAKVDTEWGATATSKFQFSVVS